MSATIQRTSAEELLRKRDDGFRYELVRGELRRHPLEGHEHGRIAARIAGLLGSHVLANSLGAGYMCGTGFLITSDPDTVRAPDLAFVSQKRLDEVADVEGYWPGAPDLAVEVISPRDTYAEVEEKVLEWLAAGARMVVVVNARKRTVTVYRSLTEIVVLTEDETLEGGDVVPGWTMQVRDMFT